MRHCMEMGWRVSALTRNLDTARFLRDQGVSKVVEAGLAGKGWHDQLDPSQDFVVNCVGAASPTLDGYEESYVRGQESVREWLAGGKAGALLFTSSISVYPQRGGSLVDETARTENASERARLLLEAEEKCLAPSPGISRSFVLRLAGIYGPDRHLLVEKLKRGESFGGNSSRTLNLIHVEDAARAIVFSLNSGREIKGGIYNVSDGSHFSRGEIVSWLADKLGLQATGFAEDDPPNSPDRKISIERIKTELKWTPLYNSFVKGYESILS